MMARTNRGKDLITFKFGEGAMTSNHSSWKRAWEVISSVADINKRPLTSDVQSNQHLMTLRMKLIPLNNEHTLCQMDLEFYCCSVGSLRQAQFVLFVIFCILGMSLFCKVRCKWSADGLSCPGLCFSALISCRVELTQEVQVAYEGFPLPGSMQKQQCDEGLFSTWSLIAQLSKTQGHELPFAFLPSLNSVAKSVSRSKQ